MLFDWKVIISLYTIIISIIIMIFAYIKSDTKIVFGYRFLFALNFLTIGVILLCNSLNHYLSDLAYMILFVIGMTSMISAIILVYLKKRKT
jgi:ABC-type polysaccharide/polyol phosphate export permease